MNRWMVSAALIAAAGVLYAETVRFDPEAAGGAGLHVGRGVVDQRMPHAVAVLVFCQRGDLIFQRVHKDAAGRISSSSGMAMVTQQFPRPQNAPAKLWLPWNVNP